VRPGADYELWFGDGVSFDLLPVSRYMWRRRGTVLYIKTPGKNVRVPICGAMRFPDGPFIYEVGPLYKHVNTSTFVGMLQKAIGRAKRTGKRIILVLDNGSAHTSAAATRAIEAAKKYVRIFWIPKYTSEQLNDVENLWGHLKDDYFCRLLAKTADQFQAKVIELLDELRKPGGVRKMLKPHEHMKTVRKKILRVA
jgi:transposase